jgi:hypothetical protein
MADETRLSSDAPACANSLVEYEAPKLKAVGNLRDLLAGTGSLPCDGMNVQPGPTPASGPIGDPSQCGPG